MSSKDFKEGMIAGAKPFGDKLDQLANVSESAVSNIKKGLDGVTQVVNVVLDDLSAQEKKRIYDLDKATDISMLEDDEKEFLVAVLAELANSIPEVTDLQRRYIMSVCSTVGIAAPQSSLNLACIENIENMRTQKILLRHVMEFFFIGTQNYDFLDYYENTIFCYFGVNKRGVNEIVNTVDRIYNAMGIEGLANRYTFVAGYEELIETEMDDGIIEAEDGESDSITDILDPSMYEKIDVSGIISVQDTKEYYQKEICLSAAFSVNGELTFKNCTINISSTASFNLAGTLIFQNCEINADITRTKDNYVITTLNESKIAFNNCIIRNGKYLINAKSDVDMENCTFINCATLIIMDGYVEALQKYKFSIKNSAIYVGESAIEKATNLFGREFYQTDCLFRIMNCEEFVASDLASSWLLESPKCEQYFLFEISANNATLSNCEFKNAQISALSSNNSYMDKCSLYNCECMIMNMSNCIIENSDINVYALDTSINKCTFENMHERTIRAKIISNSTFNNIHNKEKQFIDITGGIDNCIFSNVNMAAGFPLIYAKLDYGLGDKKKDIVVSNCRFINCYTERSDKKLISGTEIHHTLFSDKEKPYEVKCPNCMGLNDVKSGTFVEKPMPQDSKMSTGAKIGAGLGAVVFGPLGLIGGAIAGEIVHATKSELSKKEEIKDGDFTFTINVVTDAGEKGVAVYGKVVSGSTSFGDSLYVKKSDGTTIPCQASIIVVNQQKLKTISAGTEGTILLKNIEKKSIKWGDTLIKADN